MAGKKEQKKGFGPLYFAELFGKFVGVMSKVLTVKLFEFLKKWILLIAQWTFYAASGLAILIGIIAAIRTKRIEDFFTSLAFAVGFFVVQYVANKFLNAGDEKIKENPTKLASPAFLESFALLTIIAGAAVLLLNIYHAIRIPAFEPLLYGVVAFLFLWFLAFILLNPKEINVNVEKNTSAGQEAIGIVSLFIKAVMKLVPILFGILVIYGTVTVIIEMFGLFGSNASFAWIKIRSGYEMVVSGGLLPLAAYLGFVLLFLALDIIRAILSVPEKLDKLIKK